jgi:AraC-like DNA-binding protein
VCRIVECLERFGVNGLALCRQSEIDVDTVRDANGWVRVGPYLRLWGAAVAATGDATFPLEVARSGTSAHDLLRFVCMHCDDLGEALTKASRYLRVLTDAMALTLIQNGEHVLVRLERMGASPAEAVHADQFAVAELISLARAFSGTTWAPYAVRFSGCAPDNEAKLKAFARAPLTFDAEHTELCVEPRTLAAPLLRADRAQARFFERYAQRELSEAGAATAFADVVRGLIETRDTAMDPTSATLAHVLGISERTLRRRLEGEGVTMRQLLAERPRGDIGENRRRVGRRRS